MAGTPDSFSQHLANRRGSDKLSGRTLNRLQSLVSVFLAYVKSIRPQDVPVNWAKGLSRCDTDDATDGRRQLKLSEFRALIAWADKHSPRVASFYRFLALTGLRYGETALTWDQVHLDDAPRIELTRRTKAKRTRVVPIHADIVPMLKSMQRAAKPGVFRVFPTRPTLRTLLDHVGKAGLDPEGVGFHSFRKLFGSQCAAQGVPLSVAQKILGHSTPTLTARFYQHLETHELAESLANLRVLAESSLDSGRGLVDTASATPMGTKLSNPDQATTTAPCPPIGVATKDAGPSLTLGRFVAEPDAANSASPQAPKPRAGFEPATCGLQNRKLSPSSQQVAMVLADFVEVTSRLIRLMGADREQQAR